MKLQITIETDEPLSLAGAIESLHRATRKHTKGRALFPDDRGSEVVAQSPINPPCKVSWEVSK